MLVLTRKEQERLVIDGNIVITVVRISGGGVKIGIDAPPEVSIKREELLDRPNAGRLTALATTSVQLACSCDC